VLQQAIFVAPRAPLWSTTTTTSKEGSTKEEE